MRLTLIGLEPPVKGVKCPQCGSDKIVRNGFQKNVGGKVRKYQCRKCNRCFLETYSPILGERRGRPSKSRPSKSVSFPIIPNLKFLFRKKVTVDSVIDVPCFCCVSNGKRGCEPKTCLKLDKWLGLDTNIPIKNPRMVQTKYDRLTGEEKTLLRELNHE